MTLEKILNSTLSNIKRKSIPVILSASMFLSNILPGTAYSAYFKTEYNNAKEFLEKNPDKTFIIYSNNVQIIYRPRNNSLYIAGSNMESQSIIDPGFYKQLFDNKSFFKWDSYGDTDVEAYSENARFELINGHVIINPKTTKKNIDSVAVTSIKHIPKKTEQNKIPVSNMSTNISSTVRLTYSAYRNYSIKPRLTTPNNRTLEHDGFVVSRGISTQYLDSLKMSIFRERIATDVLNSKEQHPGTDIRQSKHRLYSLKSGKPVKQVALNRRDLDSLDAAITLERISTNYFYQKLPNLILREPNPEQLTPNARILKVPKLKGIDYIVEDSKVHKKNYNPIIFGAGAVATGVLIGILTRDHSSNPIPTSTSTPGIK